MARPLIGSRKTLFDRLGRYEKGNGPRTISRYVGVAKRHGLDPAQMAIAFAVSRPFVLLHGGGADAAELELADDVLEDIEQIHLDTPNPCP